MKLRNLTLSLLLLIASAAIMPEQAQAQWSKKLKKKLEKKAGELLGNGKEESKTDEEPAVTNTSQQEVADSVNMAAQEAQAMENLGSLFGMNSGEPIELPDSYEFSSNIVMYMTMYDENGNKKSENGSSAQYTYLFPKSEEADYLGMKMTDLKSGKEQGTMVISGGQMVSFTEQNGQKIALSIPFDQFQGPMGQSETENPDETPSFKKTGKSKDILGYTCAEYLMENSEMKSNLWIANGMQKQAKHMQQMFLAFAKSNQKTPEMEEAMGKGMMLAMDSFDKKTKVTTSVIAKEINLDKAFTFSTKGYEMMNMGSMMKKMMEQPKDEEAGDKN